MNSVWNSQACTKNLLKSHSFHPFSFTVLWVANRHIPISADQFSDVHLAKCVCETAPAQIRHRLRLIILALDSMCKIARCVSHKHMRSGNNGVAPRELAAIKEIVYLRPAQWQQIMQKYHVNHQTPHGSRNAEDHGRAITKPPPVEPHPTTTGEKCCQPDLPLDLPVISKTHHSGECSTCF